MKVAMIGLGKLGLPLALAIDGAGHEVTGYDPNFKKEHFNEVRAREEGAKELLKSHNILVTDFITEAVSNKQIVFVVVQTPHAPGFDGSTALPDERRDFEYGYLENALRSIQGFGDPVIAVVSTVLPGTMERLRRCLAPNYRLVYNPSLCAMGTVIPDFQNPEFTLIGHDFRDVLASSQMITFYRTIHQKPIVPISIPSAELAKMAYNPFIGMKIAFANTLMEISHHTGADVDEVRVALSHATERLLSPKYLQAGMGDGGPCHPRDNIAMSWLADRLGLSSDLFRGIMEMRERQSTWLARMIKDWSDLTGMDIVVLGQAYKAESSSTDGSPALLLREKLKILGAMDVLSLDPLAEPEVWGEGHLRFVDPHVFVIATKHEQFRTIHFPKGSVVIDPWGYISGGEGVTVIRVGRK